MRTASYLAGAIALLGLGAFAAPRQEQGGGARMARDLPATSLPLDRWQPKRLPSLPPGMTMKMITDGDSLYRGKGGCVTCHGPDGFGMPNAGSAVTMGTAFIPNEWAPIDSLITAGIPEALTRTTVAMPPRGAAQNLTPEETKTIAAYIWAISRVADEPWPGGHRTHTAAAAARDTAKATP